jgi:hypothetical protein
MFPAVRHANINALRDWNLWTMAAKNSKFPEINPSSSIGHCSIESSGQQPSTNFLAGPVDPPQFHHLRIFSERADISGGTEAHCWHRARRTGTWFDVFLGHDRFILGSDDDRVTFHLLLCGGWPFHLVDSVVASKQKYIARGAGD